MPAYLKARRSRTFDEIVVASSDAGLFRTVSLPLPPPPVSMYRDPFLVGLVDVPDIFETPFRIGTSGRDVNGAAAFLIAQWGLREELSEHKR